MSEQTQKVETKVKHTSKPEPVSGEFIDMPLAARERAEIEIAVSTAKHFPRNEVESVDKAKTMACMNEDIAASMMYALPRAGGVIPGPSVRLAEIMMTCWKNIVIEADIAGEDARFVYAVGTCRDLESNVAARVKVRRRITKKTGQRYDDDMIGVTANAAISIAIRNALFRVIPYAYVEDVYRAAAAVATGGSTSIAQRRAQYMARLLQMGATEERVLAVLERKQVEDITAKDLEKLIGLGTAIKDGDKTVDEVFPPIKETPQAPTPTDVVENGTVKEAEPDNEVYDGEKDMARKGDMF